ncbi:hypothetical protein Vi05172_g5115 [Venturia inaequalis]|nr:hypothetical protein Vi05172_g5115 [Venturia inaequalis]
MAPSKNSDQPSLPIHTSTTTSVATRACDNLPWTTHAVIVWPSEQDETILKILLRKYKSKTLRALLLTKEESIRFEKYRLDHIWKDPNARYLEKDYPPPEVYAQWDRSDNAALPDRPTLKRTLTREEAVIREDEAANTQTGIIEDGGIKIAITERTQLQRPTARPRSLLHTNNVPQHFVHKTLQDVEREIHLHLLTSKQRPGRAHQVVDLQQPVDFDEALQYLESLNIPSGVGRVKAVGIVSGSPSSVYSEWEDEDEQEKNEGADMVRLGGRELNERIEMKKRGSIAVPRDPTIDFARRNRNKDLDMESRLLSERNGYGLFLKNNGQAHGPGRPSVQSGFWARQEDVDEYEETDSFENSTKSKSPLSRSRIPTPIPSGRLRTPRVSRRTKRRTGRPPSRLPRPNITFTKRSAAAINLTRQPPNAILPGLDDLAISGASEVNRSSRSFYDTFKNWVTNPPMTPQRETQPTQSEVANTSTPSSLDLNNDLEKRIDSGFHLSSLPASNGKTETEEAGKSPLSGYSRRIKDADGLERLVQPSSVPRPRTISGDQDSRQTVSPVKVMRGTQVPLPLDVRQARESRSSGSKAVAGGMLVGNLAIEDSERVNERADESVIQQGPAKSSRKVGYSTFPSLPTSSSDEGDATREIAEDTFSARAPVGKSGVAERFPPLQSIPTITITTPSNEENATNQALRTTVGHAFPSQTAVKAAGGRGAAEQFPSFLPVPVPTLAARARNRTSRSRTRSAVSTSPSPQTNEPRTGGSRRRPIIRRTNVSREEETDVGPSGNTVLRLSLIDVHREEEEEADAPDSTRGGRDLCENMASIDGQDETSDGSRRSTVDAIVDDENHPIALSRFTIPVREPYVFDGCGRAIPNSKVRDPVKGGGVEAREIGTRILCSPAKTSFKDEEKVGERVEEPADEVVELSNVNEILAQKWQGASEGLILKDVASPSIPLPPREKGDQVDNLSSPADTTGNRTPTLSFPGERIESEVKDILTPLPTSSSHKKHALRPSFLLQSPDIHLSHEHLSAKWRYFAALTPPGNPVAKQGDDGPFVRFVFQDVPLLSIPMQRFLQRKKADLELNRSLSSSSPPPPSSSSQLPRAVEGVRDTGRGERMNRNPPLRPQTTSRLPRRYGSGKKGAAVNVRIPADRGRLVERILLHPSVKPSTRRYRSERDRPVVIPPLQPAQFSRAEPESRLPISPGRCLQRDLSQSEINLVQRHREDKKVRKYDTSLSLERREALARRVDLGGRPDQQSTLSPLLRTQQPRRMVRISNMVEEIVPRIEMPRTPPMPQTRSKVPETRSAPRNACEIPRTPPLPPSGLMVHDSGEWNTLSTIRNPSPGFPVLERIERYPSHNGSDEGSESLTTEMAAAFSNFSGVVPHSEQSNLNSHLPLQQSPYHYQRSFGGRIERAFSTKWSAFRRRDTKTAQEEGERNVENGRRRIEAPVKEESEGRRLRKGSKRWSYGQRIRRVLLCGGEDKGGRVSV